MSGGASHCKLEGGGGLGATRYNYHALWLPHSSIQKSDHPSISIHWQAIECYKGS